MIATTFEPEAICDGCGYTFAQHSDTKPIAKGVHTICGGTEKGFRLRTAVYSMKRCEPCMGRTEHRDGVCMQHPPSPAHEGCTCGMGVYAAPELHAPHCQWIVDHAQRASRPAQPAPIGRAPSDIGPEMLAEYMAAAPAKPAAAPIRPGWRVLPETYNAREQYTCRSDSNADSYGVVFWAEGRSGAGWSTIGDRKLYTDAELEGAMDAAERLCPARNRAPVPAAAPPEERAPVDEKMDAVDGCTRCGWRGDITELVGAVDNDACPGCGARGSMTTYYGPDELRGHELAIDPTARAPVGEPAGDGEPPKCKCGKRKQDHYNVYGHGDIDQLWCDKYARSKYEAATPVEPERPVPTLLERINRFKQTTGALSGGNTHPDRCVCQGDDPTPHTHYVEPPHSCARCGHLRCKAYEPAEPSTGAPAEPAPVGRPCGTGCRICRDIADDVEARALHCWMTAGGIVATCAPGNPWMPIAAELRRAADAGAASRQHEVDAQRENARIAQRIRDAAIGAVAEVRTMLDAERATRQRAEAERDEALLLAARLRTACGEASDRVIAATDRAIAAEAALKAERAAAAELVRAVDAAARVTERSTDMRWATWARVLTARAAIPATPEDDAPGERKP